ncbi:unnamed protein product [Paramecium sonneborni]|uniref:Uncharacterized protein n=1 Tax=Paramecium sonneborni TaxID=65129 RepID=A0A8S1R9B7_9CILI|nr:unnamed protein product [Paramecium sonneborni]
MINKILGNSINNKSRIKLNKKKELKINSRSIKYVIQLMTNQSLQDVAKIIITSCTIFVYDGQDQSIRFQDVAKKQFYKNKVVISISLSFQLNDSF